MSFGDDTLDPNNHWFSKLEALQKNQELRSSAHRRFVAGKWTLGSTEDIRFLALALCGEAGELANFIKKEWRGDTIDQAKIYKEMVDVYNYLMHLADIYGIDLVEISNIKYETEINDKLVAQGK